MTVNEFLRLYRGKLSALYEKEEMESIIALVAEDVLGFRRIDLTIQKESVIGPEAQTRLETILNSLSATVPVQYALGHAWFGGLKLTVTPDVLIPRRETEELVYLIAEDLGDKPVRILDIGTGSGCIALLLKKLLPEAVITAIDISEPALTVARLNAKDNQLDVNFIHLDLFEPLSQLTQAPFDVIVSNPPYIPRKKESEMHDRVKKHEPSLALFVPDEDPLLYYRHIAESAVHLLKQDGTVYFEINEDYGRELQQMLSSLGFHDIGLYKDMQGKDRMIRASRSTVSVS